MTGLLLAVIYLAFISLGLPDALLGAAWPAIYQELDVPISGAGIISMIIACGTVSSSLLSDRLTRALGTGLVTAASVALTAAALYGFSQSRSFAGLCLLALPYGLGAGGVDAALNNYVALHYASKHMSWLHCMWGIGVTTGPAVMGMALSGGHSWNTGYWYISLMQIGLTAVLVASLPLWQKRSEAQKHEGDDEAAPKPLSLREVVRLPGVLEIMACFFCYCTVENSAMLWASSYLHLEEGIAVETATSLAGMFCLGITIGRGINGFIAIRLNDRQMIRMGLVVLFLGVLILLLPMGRTLTVAGFVLIGLGCAPVYPCLMHATPALFGVQRSQAVIGLQMAAAHLGVLLMPPLFGVLANHISISLLPWFLLCFLLLLVGMNERMNRRAKRAE